MPTVLPFHRAVVLHPAFAPVAADEPFSVHTRWIESESDIVLAPQSPATTGSEAARERLIVEVGGKRLEVTVPVSVVAGTGPAAEAGAGAGTGPGRRRGAPRRQQRSAASGAALISPMQGTIVTIAVTEGQSVSAGEVVVVLEAMKMEQPLQAHTSGTVTRLSVA